MAFAHGRSGYFKLGTVDLSAWLDKVDPSFDSDTHETTTYGKTYKTRSGGLKDVTWSISGMYDSAAGGPETIIPPMVGTTVVFEWGPEGNAATKVKYSGSVVVKSYTPSAPVGDMIRFNCSLEGTDTTTKGVYP